MSSDAAGFFSREELLGGGLSARRASTLLFAIESRTGYLMSQSRQAVARYLTPKSVEGREQAFLTALSRGRDLPIQPTIQDLERYAPRWADLVPDNPGIKAALARLIGEKYMCTAQAVPRLRAALGLDEAAVRKAYETQYRQPLERVYAPHIAPRERLRWLWSRLARRLEELPPFWTAFSLTLTETVGASILALPIALAGIGPLAGVALLLLLGLVNILTVAGLVEAITRNGNMRYGHSYFGHLVNDYLGRAGTLILTVALFVLNLLALIAYYTGVATALAEAMGVSKLIWAGLLFLLGLYFLRRESLDATIASALVVGFANIGLILVLSLIALPHARAENLSYVNVPFLIGRPFDPTILGLIFGVVLSAYFGHTSAANAAKVVLQRDPGGRSLLWGNVAALATAGLLYSLWIVGINGAISPAVLADAAGTALRPLAEQAGPVVFLFGSLFVILGMGMASIHFSLGLFNQMREWLPVTTLQLSEKPAARGGTALRRALAHRNARFALSVAPVAFVFLFVEWLLWTGRESFTGMLSLIGVIVVPLLTGIFPVLMLVASRRKGDYVPAVAWRFLGHPLVAAILYLLFFASILLHGLVIWQEPAPRAAALTVALLLVGITLFLIRRGTFTPRCVVELRLDETEDRRAGFSVTSTGRPALAAVQLSYRDNPEPLQPLQAASGEIDRFAALGVVTFHLPASRARELKVWAHRVTPAGISEGLPALLQVDDGRVGQALELQLVDGPQIQPLTARPCQIKISLS